MTRLLARGALSLLALACVGCLSADPDHCANREGNPTCAAIGAAPYCSICASENAGCVEEQPDDRCYRPGDESSSGDATGSTTDSPTSESAGSTAPEVDCVADGLDESCPALVPYCVDGVCSSCTDAGAGFCAGIDAATPACHPGSGLCLACVGNSDCAMAVCGDPYACVECTQHADCPGSACDLGTGECFDADVEVWVDPSGCSEPFGTMDDPYCTFVEALANVDQDQIGVVHLVGSSMPIEEPIDLTGVNDRTLIVLGESRPIFNVNATAIMVGNGSTIFVDGVRIIDSDMAAVSCGAQSRAWLTDVELTNNATALSGDDCQQLVLERSSILRSVGNAIVLENSTLLVTSSALVDNGNIDDTSAIRATDSDLTIRYSTLAGNRGSQDPSISCTGTTGTIRNSVLVSSQRPSFECPGVTLQTSVIDSPVDGEGVQVVETYDPEWFDDVGAGDISPRNPDTSPFRDVAIWSAGDPLRDLSGERRLAYPGLAEFAGADQP